MGNKYMNEEQVKNTIIIPFFEKLGFKRDEVEFETNFKIMIPRQGQVQVGTTITKNVYSDILYKTTVNGKLRNIFLVEVKRENHKIDEVDIEQAITYARLLPEIPPFSIVSNGIVTKVFDSITKAEITDLLNSNFVKSGFRLTINEDIRDEALETLIGLDKTNLISFCKALSESNFEDVRSEQVSSKSIINELHCVRPKYINDFLNFLKSSYKVYGIVGKSGYGKTNLIYSIWDRHKNEFPFVFYNAGLLNEGIAKSIQGDFQFLLKRDYSLVELFRKFDVITKKNNQKFFIIIDGLDEHPNTIELRNEINDLVKKIKDTNIYLIVSCKITDDDNDIWFELTNYKGAVNSLGDNIYKSPRLYYQNRKGTFIDEMDELELASLWDRYKKIYNLKGQLIRESKELSKQPFLLRMIGEVYQNQEIECDITEVQLYKKWIDKKLEQTEDSDMCKLVLNKIVSEIITSKCENIVLERALELISTISNGYQYIKNLIKLGVLDISKDKDNIKYISVCNSTFLNYIYCYEVKKWHLKSIIELIEPFNEYIRDDYFRYILIFFISSMQSKFNKEGTNWNQVYDLTDKKICISCGEDINYGDEITQVLNMDKSEFMKERNLGMFHIIHNSCSKNGPSIFDLRPEIKNAILNCDDFLALLKIQNFFKFTPKLELEQMSKNSKKRELKTKPYFDILPKADSVGEPFWAIMEFIDEINTGEITVHKVNDSNCILLFNSRIEAETYLFTQKEPADESYSRAVGLTRKYFEGLNNVYNEHSIKNQKAIIFQGFNYDGGISGMLVDLSVIMDIVNSGLSLREYAMKKSNLRSSKGND